MPEKSCVLVVSDSAVVRAGVRALIGDQPDINVVGEAADGVEAAAKTRTTRPSIILMDMARAPERLTAISIISREAPEARILILAGAAEDELIFPAFRAGSVGVLRDSSPEDLLRAIRETPVDAPARESMTEAWGRESSKRRNLPLARDSLTAQEFKVLRLMAQGLSNAEIAAALSIEQRTARNYVSNVLSKLQVTNRVQATLYALRHRLTRLEDL
jgi:NarL family two-component system response regulator LiaR